MTSSETFTLWAVPIVVIGAVIIVVTLLAWKRKWIAAVATTAVSLLLVAIAGPSYFPARYEAQKAVCRINLREIDEAKASWAKEKGKSPTDEPTEADVAPWFKHGIPRCPSDDRSYRLGRVSESASCPNSKTRGHVLGAASK